MLLAPRNHEPIGFYITLALASISRLEESISRAKRISRTHKSPFHSTLKNCLPTDKQFFVYVRYYLSLFSHCWLAIPQLVLQADWQEVWHSPQPPFFALSQRFAVSRVLICSIFYSSVMFIYIKSIS